jgi:hypothetical protein
MTNDDISELQQDPRIESRLERVKREVDEWEPRPMPKDYDPSKDKRISRKPKHRGPAK